MSDRQGRISIDLVFESGGTSRLAYCVLLLRVARAVALQAMVDDQRVGALPCHWCHCGLDVVMLWRLSWLPVVPQASGQRICAADTPEYTLLLIELVPC
jgi:hypothetical protein